MDARVYSHLRFFDACQASGHGVERQIAYATTLPNIHHDNEEIQNAVNAGKVVTTHTNAISYGGGHVAGYIVQDLSTGSQAYMIAGGNGGGIWWLGAVGGASAAFVLGIAAFLATTAVATASALIVFWVLILAMVLANVALMMQNYSNLNDEDKACYLGGILTGFGFSSLMTLPGWLGKLTGVLGIAFNAYGPTSTGPQCEAF